MVVVISPASGEGSLTTGERDDDVTVDRRGERDLHRLVAPAQRLLRR
jgi:hypothetical protein